MHHAKISYYTRSSEIFVGENSSNGWYNKPPSAFSKSLETPKLLMPNVQITEEPKVEMTDREQYRIQAS